MRELVQGAPNQFDLTVRGKPERWTALAWLETYGFKSEGYGWASRTDKYIVGQFSKSMNPKDGYVVSDCEDFRTKQVLEFLILILYPKKPTRVTIIVGNTIFGALLGDQPIDWGLLIYDVVAKMVGLVSKDKPIMVCPYMFHLYKERQVLQSSELATYTLAMEMVKYDCTLEPELEPNPTPSQSGSKRQQPTLTPERKKKRKTSANKQGESSAPPQDPSMDEPSASEVEQNAQSFDNAITWIKMVGENFDALEQIVKDVAEVLEIANLRDFDRALGTILRPRDLADRDTRIRELQNKRAILNAQIAQKESDWVVANQKTGEALNLLTQFQSYVGQPGEIVTKARIFDETVAKGLPVTRSKVINIVVDYSAKMEALLLGMQKLMADIHTTALPTGSIDLTDFPKISATEILQDLSTSTKDCRSKTASPSLPADPGSDARMRPTDKPPLLEAPPMDPSLPSDPAPLNPPPPSPAPPKVPPTLPPSSLSRPKVVVRPPLFPSPQVTTPPPLPNPAAPIKRNLPFSQGSGRRNKNQPPPRFSHFL